MEVAHGIWHFTDVTQSNCNKDREGPPTKQLIQRLLWQGMLMQLLTTIRHPLERFLDLEAFSRQNRQ